MRIVGITGGVDTHADVHVAAAVDRNGGLLGVESFPADQTGYPASGPATGWFYREKPPQGLRYTAPKPSSISLAAALGLP